MNSILGRKAESLKLQQLNEEERSHFIAVYGRRRVGKTFLIRSFFDKFTFHHTGLRDGGMKDQLLAFFHSLKRAGHKIETPPATWIEAFHQLELCIDGSKLARKVVFLDELPWMDTPRSGFLTALEHFWNGWASARRDVLFIVCGSATSWIVNKLFNNRGGLHNRVTHRMKIKPFDLSESEEFLVSRGIQWDRYQIVKAYMAFGGIPFYLEALTPGKSADQCIDEVIFHEDGLLHGEYQNLYAALFKNSENYERIIEVLAKKNKGLTRKDIVSQTSLDSGGGLTRMLSDLELSDFIRIYSPFQKSYRLSLYQLVDAYSLFYHNFVHGRSIRTGDWLASIDHPRYRAWSGYAFEMVCIQHLDQIKRALGISGVHTEVSSWINTESDDNAQIDLVIDRRDQVINLFEMKYAISEYVISKAYAHRLREKTAAFRRTTKTKKSIFLSMLTTYGVKDNAYRGMVQNDLNMDVLFEPQR